MKNLSLLRNYAICVMQELFQLNIMVLTNVDRVECCTALSAANKCHDQQRDQCDQ